MNAPPWRTTILTWIPLTPLVYFAGIINRRLLSELPPILAAAITAAAIIVLLQRAIMPSLLTASRRLQLARRAHNAQSSRLPDRT